MPALKADHPFQVLAKPMGPACNLECAYCYYLEKKALYPHTPSFRMSNEIMEQYIRMYIEDQPPGTRNLVFMWQGGEPTLMGIEFFKQALAVEKKYAREGMTTANAIQTNGTLLDDEWGRFLHQENFLVGLSIDGPDKIHNRYRSFSGGKNSFDDVMRGIDTCHKHKIEFNTLTVVHNDNSKYPREIYDFLKEIGSTFLQFIPIVEHTRGRIQPERLGDTFQAYREFKMEPGVKMGSRSVRPDDWGLFLNKVFDRWMEKEDIGKVYIQYFDLMLGLVLGYPASLCTHARVCGNEPVIEHNGDIYNCDHFVNKDHYLGNIKSARLAQIISQKQRDFGTKKYKELPGVCNRCAFLQYCYGACPKDRIALTQDGKPGLQYLCPGYKMFYQHTLPYLDKMAQCIRMERPASEWRNIDAVIAARHNKTVEKKIARNARCPCGSGKKYKKCCGKATET
jgi:uncharacterized protein